MRGVNGVDADDNKLVLHIRLFRICDHMCVLYLNAQQSSIRSGLDGMSDLSKTILIHSRQECMANTCP